MRNPLSVPPPRAALFVAAAFAILLAPDLAQARRRWVPPPWYEYAVPFTCGTNPSDTSRAVPGDYAVAVQILNTSTDPVRLRKQIRLSYPPGAERAGASSDVIRDQIPGELAIQVSCDDIINEFVYVTPLPTQNDKPGLIQGFMIIRAGAPLEVSVSHSAASASGDIAQNLQSVVGRSIANCDYYPPADEPKQITICHRPPGNPKNAHTIEIGEPAWPAHRAHGDYTGECREDD